MFGFARWLPRVAVIAGAVLLGTASPASADIEIGLSLSDGSGDTAVGVYDVTKHQFVSTSLTGNANGTFSYGTIGSSPTLMFVGTVGSFYTNGFAGSSESGSANTPGTPSLATSTENNSYVTNTASGNGSASLTVEVSATGFNSPQSPPPLNLNDTITASMVSGTGSVTSAQGFADSTNALWGQGTPGALLSLSSVPTTGSSSDNGTLLGAFAPNGNTYSLSFTSTFNVSNGGEVNVVAGGVSTTTPEPASMITAIVAVPFLALGAWLRRRKQVAIA